MTIWFEEAIPLEKSQITEILRNNLPVADREISTHFARLLEAFCNDQFQKILKQLYTYYQPFNPNTNSPISLDEREELRYVQSLIHHFRRFLEQAQYQPIAEADIRDILKQTKILGIKLVLPPERYREFLLYYRGREIVTQSYRTWKTLWLKKNTKVFTNYKGLNLLFRPFHKSLALESEDSFHPSQSQPLKPQPITLKFFHNIQQHLLPIILPGILIKISLKTKFYLIFLFFLTVVGTTALAWLGSTSWYALFGLMPFCWFIYEILQAEKRTKQYQRNLLTQLYHKNVSNNSGVLRYLVDRISEETYKQDILVLYALWKRQEWAFGAICLQDLQQYLKKFLLEYFGLNVNLSLDNIVARLISYQNQSEYYKFLTENFSFLPSDGKTKGETDIFLPCSISLLEAISAEKCYLKQAASENATYFDLENESLPLPKLGILEIAPGSEHAELIPFQRDEFLLQINHQDGLEFSHPQGAALRWILDNPIRTSLACDCLPDSNVLIVQKDDSEKLPLQGLGKILVEDKILEFRYHRKRGENNLFLDGGLRYRHSPTPNHPVLVRPMPPQIILTSEVNSQSLEIRVPSEVQFPKEGLLKLDSIGAYEILPYFHKDERTLQLQLAPQRVYPLGTFVTLTPPITRLSQNLKKGDLLAAVEHTQYFHKRGILIFAPNTEFEERIPFRGEIWELSLEKPLKIKHRQGSLVFLKDIGVKSNLIYESNSKTKKIYIQGITEDINQGIIQIDPGENYQETVSFKVVGKSFDLNATPQFFHSKNTIIWEAILESPLRYEAFQGSHLITVENANYFPLSGILEIHYNGVAGIKEVLPFMRTHCSNTLILKTQIKQMIKHNTHVVITAVEIATEKSCHYHQQNIHVDFSSVPEFPEEGQAIFEPGSQSEEKITFKRYPNRIYLHKPLQYFHGQGSLLDFSHYAGYSLKEGLQIRQERISLEFQHLLPQHGSLILTDTKGKSEVIWYRKKNNRIVLKEPCRFHHSQESLIILPTLNKNVRLSDWVEKGMKEFSVTNAQELPLRGKIEIEGLFHSETVEFVRNGEVLFLSRPLQYSFSRFAYISMPEIYLNNHASPGMDYLEVSDASYLPENSELVIEPEHKYEERMAFQYNPEILWLYKPLTKNYEPGTIVHSPELLAKGAGNLEVFSLNKSTDILQDAVVSRYLRPISQGNSTNKTVALQDIHTITQMYLKQITDIDIENSGI